MKVGSDVFEVDRVSTDVVVVADEPAEGTRLRMRTGSSICDDDGARGAGMLDKGALAVVDVDMFLVLRSSDRAESPPETDERFRGPDSPKGLGTVKPSSRLTARPPSRVVRMLPSIGRDTTRFRGDLSFRLASALMSRNR